MYWIHRIGRGVDNTYAIHFDALWHLLKVENCLTVGWQCFVDDAAIVAAVEHGDFDNVKKLMTANGISEQYARALANFSQFKAGDIVAVLPITEYEENFLVVEIKSSPKNVLSASKVHVPFTVNLLEPSGRVIDFDPNVGFVYVADKSPVDAGFFCEVDILKSLPLSSRSSEFKILCDNVLGTNAPLTNFNKAMIPVPVFCSRISR